MDGIACRLVRRADHAAALEAAAGDERREAARIVVASAVPRRFPSHLRRAAELAAHPDDGRVEQSFRLEIHEEVRHGAVGFVAPPLHRLEVALVRIPSRNVHRDVGDAVFDQTARGEKRLPDLVASVAVAQLLRFQGEVEYLGGVTLGDAAGLHPRRVEGGGGGGVHARLARFPEVEFGEKVEALLRPFRRDSLRRHDAVHGEVRGVGFAARHERGGVRTEEAHFAEAPFGAREDHIGRQIALIGLAFFLGDHRADGGTHLAAAGQTPCLHQIGSALVAELRMRHAADQGVEVGAFRQLRPPFVDLHPRHIGGDGLQASVIVVGGVGLRVERLDLAGAAPQPDFDNTFRRFHGQILKRNSLELTRHHATSRSRPNGRAFRFFPPPCAFQSLMTNWRSCGVALRARNFQ